MYRNLFATIPILIFHTQRSSDAQPLPPNPNQTGIQINWTEGVVKIIKIRHRHIEMATKLCCVNLEPVCGQGRHAKLALDVQARRILTARQSRWGR